MSTVLGQVASTSVEIGGKEITFETGKFAKQADGAVAVRSGDTLVLATAVGRPEAREGADFFPLTVEVEERAHAAGKIQRIVGVYRCSAPRKDPEDPAPRRPHRSLESAATRQKTQ